MNRTLTILAAVALLAACGERRFTPVAAPTTTDDPAPATASPATTVSPPATLPSTTSPPVVPVAEPASTGIHAAVSARQLLTVSEAAAGSFGAAVAHEPDEPPAADIVATWIVELTKLERALDADMIRSLGDDPVFEAIAGPVGDLDAATVRVLTLLDPPTGEPDVLGSLVEAQAAVVAWEAAVPGMEEAWDDAVARWTDEWETAVADWEQEWADAVAEWEAEWATSVAEWEQEWADAVAEWEAEWADAVAEWEQEWADAVAEWESEWQEALARWQEERRTETGG